MPGLPTKSEREGLLRRFFSGLSFPKLFLLLAGLFVLDFFVPDPIPLFDEAVLGILTVMLGTFRDRREKKGPAESRTERPRLGG
jgi:hypothetical protein